VIDRGTSERSVLADP